MSRTVDRKLGISFDSKMFVALLASFIIWDTLTVHFGLLSLLLGVNYAVTTTPRYRLEINRLVCMMEQGLPTITDSETWLTIRPVIYILFSIVLSVAAYLVAV